MKNCVLLHKCKDKNGNNKDIFFRDITQSQETSTLLQKGINILFKKLSKSKIKDLNS